MKEETKEKLTMIPGEAGAGFDVNVYQRLRIEAVRLALSGSKPTATIGTILKNSREIYAFLVKG